jgi:hypothetical protein
MVVFIIQLSFGNNKILHIVVLVVILLAGIFAAQQQVYAWKLKLELADASHFGTSKVCASIQAQYGFIVNDV